MPTTVICGDVEVGAEGRILHGTVITAEGVSVRLSLTSDNHWSIGARCHLLIDGDDTLWENNISFEQAIHTFITFLDHSQFSRDEVHAMLDEVERLMGYGVANLY